MSNNKRNYLELLVDFLNEYRNLFVRSNTEFIKHNVLETIPENWFNFYKENAEQKSLENRVRYSDFRTIIKIY